RRPDAQITLFSARHKIGRELDQIRLPQLQIKHRAQRRNAKRHIYTVDKRPPRPSLLIRMEVKMPVPASRSCAARTSGLRRRRTLLRVRLRANWRFTQNKRPSAYEGPACQNAIHKVAPGS